MKKNNVVLLGALMFAALAVLMPGIFSMQTNFGAAADLIISFEGFAPHPYWDYKRYSWGYGTKAPGSTGTITEPQARQELIEHVQNDYDYLQPLLTRQLSRSQWAALLSFSYNLGPGNADNLVPNINSGDDSALHAQWLQYVYAGGVYNADLGERRAAEWEMWVS